MAKKNEITRDDDKNRRDRDNKPDRNDIRELETQQQRRGDLRGGGKTQGARTKQNSGK